MFTGYDIDLKFSTEKLLEISLWYTDLKKLAKKECLREIRWHYVACISDVINIFITCMTY